MSKKIYKNDYTNLHGYAVTDDGAFGKALEACLTGKRCKTAGKVDFWYAHKAFESKTGAGELGFAGHLLPGVQYVLYCPVVIADADGSIDPYKQEAFVLTRQAFLETLEAAGAIREKTTTAGYRKITIQTFWNRKLGKPHGALLYRLLDGLYDNCECTLEEMLAE